MKNNSKKIIFLIQKIFYTSKSFLHISVIYPAGNYMFKVNNTNFRTRTLKRHQWRHSGIFIINFEHISHLLLVFLLLTLNFKLPTRRRSWKNTTRRIEYSCRRFVQCYQRLELKFARIIKWYFCDEKNCSKMETDLIVTSREASTISGSGDFVQKCFTYFWVEMQIIVCNIK